MRKNITLICVGLAAALAAQGCINHEIRLDSFEELCIASGGETYAKGSNQCMCGTDNDKTLCASGIVCSNSGRTCASTSLIGTICSDSEDEIVDYQICENIGNRGYNLACLKDSNDGKYRWTEQEVCKPSENTNANRADNDEDVSCTVDNDRKSICGECLNGEYGCLKSEKDIYELVQCVDGKWADEVVENVCRNMINSSERSIGVKLGCTSEGILKTEMECTYGNDKVVSCHYNDCGVCLDGEARCLNGGLGATLEYCTNGHWEYLTACDSGNCMNVDEEIATARCTECKPGSGKCENDIIYHCDDNGMWVLVDDCLKKFKSCNPNKNYESEIPVCGECQHGEVNCTDSDNKGAKKICQYGEWSESIPCEDENKIQKSCSSSTSCGECTNDDTKCQNNMHFVCNNGNWIMDKVCEFGCNDDSQVASCNECSTGTIKCENDDNGIAKYSVCMKGIWTEKSDICTVQDTTNPEADVLKYSCAFHGVLECVKGENGNCKKDENDNDEFAVECGKCINNEYECGNNTGEINICENGKMVTKHESIVCIDDETGGSERWCNIDNKQTAIRECKDDENEPVSCKGNNCGDCLNGTLQCNSDGSRLDVCRNGAWEFASFCVSGICQDGKCLECNGSETKCENGVVYTCNESGLWASPENCIATEDGKYGIKEGDFVSCNISNDECGECKDGIICLNDEERKGYRITCNNGVWGNKKYCFSNNSCKSEQECGDCVNGTTECLGSKIRTCVNGAWDEYVDCPNGADCKNGVQCGDCSSSSISICRDSKTLAVCSNGEWKTIEICSENHFCQNKPDGSGECAQCLNKCEDYESGGKRITCSPGGRLSEVSCTVDDEPVSCDKNECGKCLNGITYQNNENDVCVQYTCIKGVESQYPSANGVSCALDNLGDYVGFGECLNGKTKLANNINQVCESLTCVNGKWGDPVPIKNDYSCTLDEYGNPDGVGICNNLKNKYEESGGICREYNCKNGEWFINEKTNNEGFSCKLDGDKLIGIGECFNGSSVYKENDSGICVIYTCKNGVLVNPESSNVSCNGTMTGLGVCVNGWYDALASGVDISHECVIAQPKLCENGAWGVTGDRMACSECIEPDNSKFIKDELNSSDHPYIKCK